MHLKIMDIDLSGCDIIIIEDEISFNGIGYGCIVKCPASQVSKLAEYTVSLLLAKGATSIMLGFKNTLHKPVKFKNHIGNLKVTPVHHMILMKKKLTAKISYGFDKKIYLKKVTASTAQQYCDLYNKIFKEVPNAATYLLKDVEELLNKKNYDVCFACHDQKVVGFCEYHITADKAVIEAIGIEEPYRKLGYATLLLNNLYYIFHAENINSVTLTTSSINKKAVKLYKKEKFGFSEILSYWYEVLL